MQYVNSILNRVFDLALDPFSGMSPWAGMCAISLLASVLVLLVFRACSDRSLIKRRKGKFVARVLELALFRQDVVVNLGSFGRVLAANFWYLAALLRPLMVSIVPLLLILVQVHSFFAYRPLRVGETALIKARLPAELRVMNQSLSAALTSLMLNWSVRKPGGGSSIPSVSTTITVLRVLSFSSSCLAVLNTVLIISWV